MDSRRTTCAQNRGGGGGENEGDQGERGERTKRLMLTMALIKFKKSVRRVKTSERTIVPTDVEAWFCGFHELQHRRYKESLRPTLRCARKLNPDMFCKLGRDTPCRWRDKVHWADTRGVTGPVPRVKDEKISIWDQTADS